MLYWILLALVCDPSYSLALQGKNAGDAKEQKGSPTPSHSLMLLGEAAGDVKEQDRGFQLRQSFHFLKSPTTTVLHEVQRIVQESQVLGKFVIVILLIIMTLVSFPMLPPFEMAAGFFFGTLEGGFLVEAGKIIGASLVWLLVTVTSTSLNWQVPQAFESWRTMMKEWPICAQVAVRLLPMPFGVKNYGLALCGVDLWSFTVSNLLADTWFSFTWTSIGAQCSSIDTIWDAMENGQHDRGFFAIIIVAGSLLLLTLISSVVPPMLWKIYQDDEAERSTDNKAESDRLKEPSRCST